MTIVDMKFRNMYLILQQGAFKVGGLSYHFSKFYFILCMKS